MINRTSKALIPPKKLLKFIVQVGSGAVSRATITYRLHKAGFNKKVAQTKSFLKEIHKECCLHFSTSHVKDTTTMWTKMPWSDELKTELYSLHANLCMSEHFGRDNTN